MGDEFCVNTESNKYLFSKFRTQFNEAINDLGEEGKRLNFRSTSKQINTLFNTLFI